MAAIKVSPKQVLAYRLGAQGVTDRPAAVLSALEGWAVQDSPPGAAATAALNRSSAELASDWLDGAIADGSVVSLYNARTATAILPAGEAANFGTALLPESSAAFKELLGNAVPKGTDDFEAPAELAVDAVSKALDGRALSRDDLHEQLRQALPDELLPWCEGCQSHHARRGLLVYASLRGRLCISGRQGRQPVFSRTDQTASWKPPAPGTAQRQLVRRYLQGYGPSTVAHLASWAGLHKSHAQELWARVEGDLVEVDAGAGTAWIHGDDADELRDASADQADGVRLLGPGDPLLQAKDRSVLVDDAAAAKRLWTAIPTTGLLLDGTTAAATWKAKKAGKHLDVTLTALGRRKPEVDAEAQRHAQARGCTDARVSWA